MKKTLIALVLAATAVPGSAMAWAANGLGGTMEFAGTLTPQAVVNPWEVQVGPTLTDLNGSLKLNDKVVNITLSKPIPLLGIRVADASKTFKGAPGIAPQIDYKNAVNVDGFNAGNTTLSLKVVKADDATVELGTLNATLSAAAINNYTYGINAAYKFSMFAPRAGQGFFGGLGKSDTGALGSEEIAKATLGALSSEYIAQYIYPGGSSASRALESNFADPLLKYSAAYGAGLKSGSTVNITLTNPATANMKWKASFPITVSYQ